MASGILVDEASGNAPAPGAGDPRWQRAATVEKIYIYPVKSFHAVSVPDAVVGAWKRRR